MTRCVVCLLIFAAVAMGGVLPYTAQEVEHLLAEVDSGTNLVKQGAASVRLGSVMVTNLQVVAGGNVITENDVATGSGTNDANKVLKLNEQGKIDAEFVDSILVVFAGAEAVDVQ